MQSTNKRDIHGGCFFESAILAILNPDLELHMGSHTGKHPEDTAHFYVQDKDGNIIDPTAEQYTHGHLVPGPAISVNKNLDFVINDKRFKTLPKSLKKLIIEKYNNTKMSINKIAKLYNLILKAKGLVDSKEVEISKKPEKANFTPKILASILEKLNIDIIPRGESQIGYLGSGVSADTYEIDYKGSRRVLKYFYEGEQFEIYKFVKNIRKSLPPEVAKHIPIIDEVLNLNVNDFTNSINIVIMEYLLPLSPAEKYTGWNKEYEEIEEDNKLFNKPIIVNKLYEYIDILFSKYLYSTLNEEAYLKRLIVNLLINYRDESERKLTSLLNTITDYNITRQIIDELYEFYDMIQPENENKFPLHHISEKKLTDKKFLSLYQALKWLKNNDIMVWGDVHWNNVMIRPSTGDYVVADIGGFTRI